MQIVDRQLLVANDNGAGLLAPADAPFDDVAATVLIDIERPWSS